MDDKFSQIENQLLAKGWVQVGEEMPLILGASLLPHMIVEQVDDKTGEIRRFIWATLTRAAASHDGWYVFNAEGRAQQSEPGQEGEPKGTFHSIQQPFEAYRNAVSVGFGRRVMTVNGNTSVIRFWEKKSKEGPSPDETLSQDQTPPPPSE